MDDHQGRLVHPGHGLGITESLRSRVAQVSGYGNRFELENVIHRFFAPVVSMPLREGNRSDLGHRSIS